MGGIYPPGLEQAALSCQGPGKWGREFRDTVFAELSEKRDKEVSQLRGITYGLE